MFKKAAFVLPFWACVLWGATAKWISVSTPHFEMYTTNGEKSAAQALQVFEQVRYFFLRNNPSRTAPDAVVRIIAFRSEKEYKPYRINEGAFAYYERSRERDYIVMQDLEGEHHQAAVHEYTHLVMEHLKLKLPIWLNEGIADVYSSLEPRGNQAMVGRAIPGRINAVLHLPMMDLRTLMGVTRDSAFYNERDKMAIFYGESWALTHMLALAPGYSAQFTRFFDMVASGTSEEDAIAKAYGKSLDEVTADLKNYVQQSTMRASIFDIKLGKMELDPVAAPLDDFHVELALADLLAGRRATSGEAETRLNALAKAHPGNIEIEEDLGYLAWERNDVAATLAHFGYAFEKGSTNVEMLRHYAGLLTREEATRPRAMEVFGKALSLKPDAYEARLDLGLLAASENKCSYAIQVLALLKGVKPESAYTLFYALAHCYFEENDMEKARVQALQARKFAKTAEQRDGADRLLHYLDEGNRR